MLREQCWDFVQHETVVRSFVTRADRFDAIEGLGLTTLPYEPSSMSAAKDGLMPCSARSPTWAQWRQPLQCYRNFVKSFAVRNGLELYVLLTP